jgi:hypothetical protein
MDEVSQAEMLELLEHMRNYSENDGGEIVGRDLEIYCAIEELIKRFHKK